jgi:hypothetical protein
MKRALLPGHLVLLTETGLALDGVIDDVEPAQNTVKNHPQNGVLEAPGNGDGEHTSETPETDSRRATLVFHTSSRTSALPCRVGCILHR